MEIKNIKAVITDWAGTVVDFGCIAPTRVIAELFAEEGMSVSQQEVRRFMGMTKKQHISSILFSDEVVAEWKSRKSVEPTENDLDRIYDKMTPCLKKILPEHSDVIPGVVEFMKLMKDNNIPVGSTTGYVAEMMEVVVPAAMKNGFMPDSMVCPTDVVQGRPAPFMVFENARRLNVFPLFEMVKIGDTIADINEGLQAGMWIIAFTDSGNEFGISKEELDKLPEDEKLKMRASAEKKFKDAGAHFVTEGIWSIHESLKEIDSYIEKGIHPCQI